MHSHHIPAWRRVLLRKLLVSDSVGEEGCLDCLRVPPPCGRVLRWGERPEKFVNLHKRLSCLRPGEAWRTLPRHSPPSESHWRGLRQSWICARAPRVGPGVDPKVRDFRELRSFPGTTNREGQVCSLPRPGQRCSQVVPRQVEYLSYDDVQRLVFKKSFAVHLGSI